MSVAEFHDGHVVSVRRLAAAFGEPVSTVGRWVGPRSVQNQGFGERRVEITGLSYEFGGKLPQ